MDMVCWYHQDTNRSRKKIGLLIEFIPEFYTFSYQQRIRVYNRNISEAKFAVENSASK